MKEAKEIQLPTLYSCTPNAACACGIGTVSFLCLCCMHSSIPLLKLDTAQYRHHSHFSQVTLLPLSPLPHLPVPFPLPLLLFTSSVLRLPSLPSPSLSSARSASSSVLTLLQPLMTCLKPTLGSTVREGTEALPNHRPSQRAAAQGKVHTQHMCAHSNNTRTIIWQKRMYSQL